MLVNLTHVSLIMYLTHHCISLIKPMSHIQTSHLEEGPSLLHLLQDGIKHLIQLHPLTLLLMAASGTAYRRHLLLHAYMVACVLHEVY